MNNKMKTLGLAFVAVAAMSMVVAAGAQAAVVHANHNGSDVVSGSQQQHVFTTDAGSMSSEVG